MSLGLASKQRLHEAVQGDVPSIPQMNEDEAYAFRNGRASDRIKYEPFELVDHPFMPNWNNVGTPGEVERARAIRTALIWAKWSKCGVALILALVALAMYHAFTEPHPPKLVSGDDIYYSQRAERLATGKSIYVTDPHEDCLVGMHKTAAGIVVVSTHC